MPHALRLAVLLYLASNLNDYQFALSPAAAEAEAGIRSTTFHKYFRLLEIEWYLMWRMTTCTTSIPRSALRAKERVPTHIVIPFRLKMRIAVLRQMKSLYRIAKLLKSPREVQFRQTKPRLRLASQLLRPPLYK